MTENTITVHELFRCRLLDKIPFPAGDKSAATLLT